MSSGPVQRQETSHLDDPVSPVSETHAAAGAREGGDDDNDGASNAQQDEARSSADDHVQDAKEKGAKPSKREKVKAHFKRFWWAHLIAFIIILAILLPIL